MAHSCLCRVAATDWRWLAFLESTWPGQHLLVAAGHGGTCACDTFDRIRTPFRGAWNPSRRFPRLAVPNSAFSNRGDLTFADVGREWRFASDSAIWHGIALADFDGDGDIDPLVTRLGEAPVFYRNESNAGRIAVRLVGRRLNTRGIGAVVSVRAPSLPVQSREVTAGGSYLSASDALRSFATGKDSVVALEVRWRDGGERASMAAPNRRTRSTR